MNTRRALDLAAPTGTILPYICIDLEERILPEYRYSIRQLSRDPYLVLHVARYSYRKNLYRYGTGTGSGTAV